MKKFYLSSVLAFTVKTLLLLYPTHVQYAATSEKALPFQKSSSLLKTDRHRVWLNLTSSDGIFKQLLMGYMAGATNGWDVNFDAVSMDAYAFADFYSINSNKKLVIQARALPLELTDRIPLGYRSAVTGDLTISIDHADGDLADLDIYLLDKETGITHNLKEGGYTFSTQEGTFNNRFEIRYKADDTLGVNEPGSISPEFTVASINKNIIIQSRDSSLSEVTVFDITGKLLYNNHRIGATYLEISNIQAGSQILLVKTLFENGREMTRKVIF